MGIKEELYRFMQPLRRRIALILGRALLVSVDDSKNIQLVRLKMLNSEEKEGIEHLQPYGLSSYPVQDSSVLIGAINGSKDQVIAITVCDPNSRIKNLNEGDVVIHRKSSDNITIKMLSNDTIEINAKYVNVNLDTGGQLNVANDNLTVDA